MRDIHKIKMNPLCDERNIITGDKYRLTVLTEGLVRLEYSEDNFFEDRATQTVLNRDFPETQYRVSEDDDELRIDTARLHLRYNKQTFSDYGLSIQVKGNISLYHSVWHYGGDLTDLGGTARTLDEIDGACELEPGLLSRNGFSIIDDSRSLLIREDGWVEPREKNIEDIYFFGYGHDYLECLKDFYYLCGKTPMLPRYALGNWWSRFYPYSESTYKELMERFDAEQIPFSVAVIDMDWHLTDIDPKYGNGWTGYTWNKKLFPDPAGFLGWLKERGMKTTLNVHPAEGLRAFEENYQEMAQALGMNTENEDPIRFDMTTPEFTEAYFTYMHHPREAEGVDFWWVDWQQGGKSRIEGLDPLWMLNHFHFLDSGRNGKRPMTFSRYAGPGSHRYPVGFSGDTITTWASLEFQPYFTSTASNIGYGWWSHDIGGHMQGIKDDEMAARWLQFGVFSPVNRLHSSNGEFSGKQPWRYAPESCMVMKEFLRLRHKMLPYLYTMNFRASRHDEPLVQPMYYRHAEREEAYEVKNQYYFGSELIVLPITVKRLPQLNAAKATAWLPEGIHFDVFTGLAYEGGRFIDMYRPLESLPVLAKAGAIIPMTEAIYGAEALSNPEALTINVYAGADNRFALYEDDNETQAYQDGVCIETVFELQWRSDKRFIIYPAEGEQSLIPERRSYKIAIYGVTDEPVSVLIDNRAVSAVKTYDAQMNCLQVELPAVSVQSRIELSLGVRTEIAENNIIGQIYPVLDRMNTEFVQKEQIYRMVKEKNNKLYLLSELKTLITDSDILGCVNEVITAYH